MEQSLSFLEEENYSATTVWTAVSFPAIVIDSSFICDDANHENIALAPILDQHYKVAAFSFLPILQSLRATSSTAKNLWI